MGFFYFTNLIVTSLVNGQKVMFSSPSEKVIILLR